MSSSQESRSIDRSSESTDSASASEAHIEPQNNSHLPAILCLHGGGSNATVFKIQARRIMWILEDHFRFVFAQGTIQGPPGFGMHVFESCAPFYRWIPHKFTPGESHVEQTKPADVEVLDQNLLKVINDNGGIDSFVGVMGFSQGARVTSGLLLRQMMENREKPGSSAWKLKFGVMIGGSYPPIGLYPGVKTDDYELLGTIPTVHAWGHNDHVARGCKALAKVSDGDDCFQFEFDGGHHLPLSNDEARDLCDLIMSAWSAGRDMF